MSTKINKADKGKLVNEGRGAEERGKGTCEERKRKRKRRRTRMKEYSSRKMGWFRVVNSSHFRKVG